MANQSEKRNQAKNGPRVRMLTIALIAITLWYLGFELLSGDLGTFKGFILFAILGGLNYFCYKQIVKCWDLALPTESYEYYIDILAINLIAQTFSPLTSYAWYIYLLIPGFFLMLFGKWFWGWITPEYVDEEEAGTDKKKKKQEKDEKSPKQKVKYIKG